jgi:putative oxidoreductase
MSGTLIRLTTLLGRVCIALIFLVSGAGKIANLQGTAAFMASKGIPAAPVVMLGALGCELGGAALVLLGFRARLGAFLLLVFLLPTTLLFHNFWSATGPEGAAQTLEFLKNLGIMGGLLLLCAYGAGPLSLDARRRGR